MTDPISHAEMIAALNDAIEGAEMEAQGYRNSASIRGGDERLLKEAEDHQRHVDALHAVLVHLKRTQPTDTADLTERARAEIKRWAGHVPNSPLVATLLDSYTLFYLAPMLAAFAASEREGAAAEARRVAIEECHIKALEQRCERTFLNDSGVIHRAGERTPWDLACTTIADAIGALASPPAPQEETR